MAAERDRERGERDGGAEEPDAESLALGEVLRRERRVDSRADPARDDDGVPLGDGERDHWTITSPSMSCRCRVQT